MRVPPSKSLTHRALVCAALAQGESTIKNPSVCEDTLATLSCLEALGIRVEQFSDRWVVHGGTFCQPTQKLFCNESGTTYRFLTALTDCLEIPCEFSGKPSLLRRPQRPDPQTSSQYLSGLLLAAPFAKKNRATPLPADRVSKSYIALTLEMQKKFGLQTEITIEGDWSSAVFLLGIGVLVKPVRLEELNPESLQGDKAIVAILKEMGGSVEWEGSTLTAKPSKLKAIRWDVTDTPDLYPILCVLAHFAKGQSHFSGTERLALKESDRLEGMKKILDPATKWVDSKDHRIIMAAAVLKLAAKRKTGVVRVERQDAPPDFSERGFTPRERMDFKYPEAVAKSWPGFWKMYEQFTR